MATEITWLGKAQDKIQGSLLKTLNADLKATFPGSTGITVYDCFGGYSQKHDEKIVLGVEIRQRNAYHTHVVKLGTHAEIANDYAGWKKCILAHNFASRIFVSVEKRDLPRRRMSIIYQDAFRLFGDIESAQGPQALEAVIFSSITDGNPDPQSVERVIRQLYTELYRWFYKSSTTDAAAALRFYKRRLRRGLVKWADEPWRLELRRDLVWLLCSHDLPDAARDCFFLEPYDYVTWAIDAGEIPQTLIGRSHGDLHGRNVLVGVQRGEAEFPAVFDYGEMSDVNVVAWDFVKLETELKVRFLMLLFRDDGARNTLLGKAYGGVDIPKLTSAGNRPTAEADPRSLRAQMLAFAFQFETILAELTRRIYTLFDPQVSEPPGGRNITGHAKLDRALGILMRIRQEAALFLGDGQPQRGSRSRWHDEFYFALAVYGLSSAKFDYKETESAFALVSAGVACAEMESARKQVQDQMRASSLPVPLATARSGHPFPSYRVPLAHAHRLWKSQQTAASLRKALKIMEVAEKHFAHAVPLHQEYVLLLAESGEYTQALRMLRPLEDICGVFRDEETLCRIGRMCKDLGDHSLEKSPVAIHEISGHPSLQWYEAGLTRYQEAYDISHNYYPGVNAATLAYLVGQSQLSKRLAKRVINACAALDLSTMHGEDCFWVLATQAEASLLLGKAKQAAGSYREALSMIAPTQRGMMQSVFTQLCRLQWALGDVTIPSIALFKERGLRPGSTSNGSVKRKRKQKNPA